MRRTNKIAISTAVAAVIAVIALLVGIGIGFAATSSIAPPAPTTVTQTVTAEVTKTVSGAASATATVTETVTEAKTVTEKMTTTVTQTQGAAGGLSGEIPIGALLPLSGPLGAFGSNDKMAVEIAVAEVNEFLESIGAGWKLKLYVEDTETKPSVALEKLMSLYAKGVKVVIGPMASASVRQLKEYADSNKILVISQSATDPKLAISGDFIYRFCPTDLYQGPVGPNFAKNLGVTHIIFVWRGDAWGDGLEEVAKKTAEELGLNVAGEIRYAPEATEFSAEVSSLADTVSKLLDQGVAPEKIMVQLISFGEARAFLLAAADYDVLWKVKWFGSDGTAYEGRLIQEPKVAEFSSTVRFVSPIFTPTKTPKYQELLEKIKAQTGSPPEPYAYNSYDEVWAVAYALLATNNYDADAIRNVLPKILEHYYGASGNVILNEEGDRIGVDYELVEIVKTDGTYEWEATGVYRTATGEIIWE